MTLFHIFSFLQEVLFESGDSALEDEDDQSNESLEESSVSEIFSYIFICTIYWYYYYFN